MKDRFARNLPEPGHTGPHTGIGNESRTVFHDLIVYDGTRPTSSFPPYNIPELSNSSRLVAQPSPDLCNAGIVTQLLICFHSSRRSGFPANTFGELPLHYAHHRAELRIWMVTSSPMRFCLKTGRAIPVLWATSTEQENGAPTTEGTIHSTLQGQPLGIKQVLPHLEQGRPDLHGACPERISLRKSSGMILN